MSDAIAHAIEDRIGHAIAHAIGNATTDCMTLKNATPLVPLFLTPLFTLNLRKSSVCKAVGTSAQSGFDAVVEVAAR